jgi:hypothetical protein
MSNIRNMSRTYFGFKGKHQLPIFMLYTIWFDEDGEPCGGRVHFNSMNLIGF